MSPASSPRPAPSPPARQRGLTLVELLIILALIGVVSAIAVPVFVSTIERTRLRRAAVDLLAIDLELADYRRIYEELPDSLAQLESGIRRDPWGRPYRYLLFKGPGWRGEARKDRFLVPINSEYDLYSVGPDGETRPPLQHRLSQDDFIRANDGAFLGLGRDF